MELTLKNEFYELTMDEMQVVDGGGAVEATQAFFGTVLVAISPVVGVGTSIVATPVGGGFAAAGVASLGMMLIGAASH